MYGLDVMQTISNVTTIKDININKICLGFVMWNLKKDFIYISNHVSNILKKKKAISAIV